MVRPQQPLSQGQTFLEATSGRFHHPACAREGGIEGGPDLLSLPRPGWTEKVESEAATSVGGQEEFPDVNMAPDPMGVGGEWEVFSSGVR